MATRLNSSAPTPTVNDFARNANVTTTIRGIATISGRVRRNCSAITFIRNNRGTGG